MHSIAALSRNFNLRIIYFQRGNFYEHDDREDSEGEAGSKDGKEGSSKDGDEGKDGEPRKQRVWRSEAVEKWGHDKFMELEQVRSLTTFQICWLFVVVD